MLHWWLSLLILLIFSNNQYFVFSLCCFKNLLFFNFCSDLYTFLKIGFIFIYVYLCACLCEPLPHVYRCFWRTKEDIGFLQPGNIIYTQRTCGGDGSLKSPDKDFWDKVPSKLSLSSFYVTYLLLGRGPSETLLEITNFSSGSGY